MRPHYIYVLFILLSLRAVSQHTPAQKYILGEMRTGNLAETEKISRMTNNGKTISYYRDSSIQMPGEYSRTTVLTYLFSDKKILRVDKHPGHRWKRKTTEIDSVIYDTSNVLLSLRGYENDTLIEETKTSFYNDGSFKSYDYGQRGINRIHSAFTYPDPLTAKAVAWTARKSGTVVYRFTPSGKLLSHELLNSTNEVLEKYTCEYDNNGNLTNTLYSGDMGPKEETRKYDSKNRLIEYKHVNANGRLHYRKYSYAANDSLQEFYEISGRDTISRFCEFKGNEKLCIKTGYGQGKEYSRYNKKNQLVYWSRTNLHDDTDTLEQKWYTYTDSGMPLMEITKDNYSNISEIKWFYTKNEESWKEIHYYNNDVVFEKYIDRHFR